jgi:hypothetical protein
VKGTKRLTRAWVVPSDGVVFWRANCRSTAAPGRQRSDSGIVTASAKKEGRNAWNGDDACRGEAFLPRPARPPHLVPAQGAQPHTPGFPALEEVWRAAKARSGCALEVLHSKSNTADTPGLWGEAPAHRGTLQSKSCSLLVNTPHLHVWESASACTHAHSTAPDEWLGLGP